MCVCHWKLVVVSLCLEFVVVLVVSIRNRCVALLCHVVVRYEALGFVL